MADSNLPGTNPPQAQAPKKETVRINLPPKTDTVGQPPVPPSAPKPVMPPLSAPKPLAPQVISAPKPPPLASKPTIQLKPAPPASISAAASIAPTATSAAVAVKGAAPKKETARIQVPPGDKPLMPKPTVRMGQTQVLSQAPASQGPAVSAKIKTAAIPASEANDPLIFPLSIAALVVSLIAFILSLMAFSA